MSGEVILVRHAQPNVDPKAPPSSWGLSERGRGAAHELASRLASEGIEAVVSSPEKRAMETATLIANVVGGRVEVVDDLREQGTEVVPWLDRGEFASLIKRAFAAPAEPVMGGESMEEAEKRFRAAIGATVSSHSLGRVVAVTHGRVLSAFVARSNPVKPFDFWTALQMPDVVRLSLPSLRFAEAATVGGS